jgi:hypothetical protein
VSQVASLKTTMGIIISHKPGFSQEDPLPVQKLLWYSIYRRCGMQYVDGNGAMRRGMYIRGICVHNTTAALAMLYQASAADRGLRWFLSAPNMWAPGQIEFGGCD